MTSDKGKAFWLGIFVIIAIGTVAWLFLFLKPTVGDGKTTLKIRFTNVEGVSIGTRVNFGGKPVGTVYAIKEIYNARSQKPDKFGNFYFYEVIARVDSKVKIYNYDEIALTTQGLLGEKSIEITPKAAPEGGKPPHLVTNDVLYARSGDRFQAVLEDTTQMIAQINSFFETNGPLVEESLNAINSAAQSINCLIGETLALNLPSRTVVAANAVSHAMHKASRVLDDVTDNQLPQHISSAAASVEDVANKLSYGNGTISQLINSDCLYEQLSSAICRLEKLLCDMNTYGLLYQYDRKWQKQKAARNKKCQELTCEEEMRTISSNLERISRTLSKCGYSEEPALCDLMQQLNRVLNELRCREEQHGSI